MVVIMLGQQFLFVYTSGLLVKLREKCEQIHKGLVK